MRNDLPDVRYLILLLLMPISWLPGLNSIQAQPTGSPAIRAAIPTASTRVPVRTDSRLWLEGSSNVRDWTCRATSMDATIEVDAQWSSVRAVRVSVPVRSLKCGDRHMEDHMYAALKAAKSAAPTYITAEFERFPLMEPGLQQQVETSGRLTIAGVERTVNMTLMRDRLPDGTHRARGTVPILMTDFGVKPPRPWGGILRTADKVLIQFEIFIAAPQ
jgi:polyisoprenoid-binding protein YceI